MLAVLEALTAAAEPDASPPARGPRLRADLAQAGQQRVARICRPKQKENYRYNKGSQKDAPHAPEGTVHVEGRTQVSEDQQEGLATCLPA